MISRLQKEWVAITFWMISVLFLAWIPKQGDFQLIFPALLFSFGSYALLVRTHPILPLKYYMIAAVLVRILVVPSFPNLSDDIFRFVWDGQLWNEGLNPYLYLPSDIVDQYNFLSQDLFVNLNSPDYYSIYPPIPQLIFASSVALASGDIHVTAMIMKAIHCAVDIGSIFIISSLVKKFKLPESRSLLYALNPLIIIELIGNLHHEGIVIFFLLVMIWCISSKRIMLASFSMAAAIATKILPVLFCPLIFFFLKGRERWIFFLATIATCILLFMPIISQPEVFDHLLNSADLYLRKFEFNASVYYLYRGLGYLVYGYNLIHILGPTLMLLCMLVISYIAYFKGSQKQKLAEVIPLLLLSYLCYVFLSITIHPWYIALLIPLCLFTTFRTPLLWSGLIMLTYINYYFEPYHESLAIVFIEYAIVLFCFLYEYRNRSDKAVLPLI